MIDWFYLLLLVLALFLVAYLPRVTPMLYFTQKKVPSWFSQWMKYIPVALFSALAFKDVFITHDHLDLVANDKILAMLIVALVSFFTRSMAASVFAGLAAIFLFAFL